MSAENAELVFRGVQSWLAGDVDGWRDTVDPEIGWDISAHPLPDVPNEGRGWEAMNTEMLETYMSGWVDYSVEVKEVIDGGDMVVFVLHETARMRDTGVPLDRDLVQVWTVRDGRATFLRVFKTKAEGLEAAGLPG